MQPIPFDGKQIVIPGIYSAIKSRIANAPLNLSFGGLIIIDTGTVDAAFGSGPGINGTLTKGKEAIQRFDNIEDFQAAVGGGLWYYLAEPLFFPGGRGKGINGISSIEYVRAATTTPAEIAPVISGGGSAGGTFVVQCRVEGTAGNGVEGITGKLTQGFSFTMEAGVLDPTKFIAKFWRGGFKGLDTAISNGEPYDGVALADTDPILLAQSPEFNNISTLISWAKVNAQFREWFNLKTGTVTGTGNVTNADLVTNSGNILAAGGTQTFNATYLANALDALNRSQADFIMTDLFGTANIADSKNILVEGFIEKAVYKKQLVLACGNTEDDFANSLTACATYNDKSVTIIHGGPGKTRKEGGFKDYSAQVKAAYEVGREAGLEPQTPITFKGIAIDRERHVLTDKQKVQAIQAGLLCSYYDEELQDFVFLKGLNSLQKNDFLVNTDGSSYSKQLNRIINQLNKEIIINGKIKFFGNKNVGANRNTVSLADIDNFIKGYLKIKTATDTQDNLILSYRNIVTKQKGEAFFCDYEVVPNFEVSYGFFTGFIIDPNS